MKTTNLEDLDNKSNTASKLRLCGKTIGIEGRKQGVIEISGGTRISVPGGEILRSGPRRGPEGAPPPRTPENLRKVAQNWIRNLQTKPILRQIFKSHALHFRAFGGKTIDWERFEEILMKIQ